MADSDDRVEQGRQYDGWCGHAMSLQSDDEPATVRASGLFEPAQAGQRIDHVARAVMGPAALRDADPISARSLLQLRTVVAVWYSAAGLSDAAFARLLPHYTPTIFIARLRSAARLMVEGQDVQALDVAASDLGRVVQYYGAQSWPGFLAGANRRALAAVKAGMIPGDRADEAGRLSVSAVNALIYQALQNGGALPPAPLENPAPLVPAKPPRDARDPVGAKAPGKPGPAEGFEDPDGGEEWVRNPNREGYGWRAKDGGVWVPTGPNAHAGAHWDVEYPGGKRRNETPSRT